MITTTLLNISAAAIVSFGQLITPMVSEQVLATHQISLENRYPVKSVSDVFRDNILLNIAYMRGDVKTGSDVNWDEIKKPFMYEFKLEPGKTFAFHDDILPQYKDSLVKTTQAHFNSTEGFKSDGYLIGDGVCHFASIIYWVAKDAGLDANAPTNHNFMAIPEISKEFGVAIYANPYTKGSSAQQNLYVTNNKDKTVSFKLEYDGTNLKVSAIEAN